MGAAPSHVASVIAEGEQETPFATRRHPDFKQGTMENPKDIQTMQDLMKKIFSQFAKNPYLGVRPSFGNKYANEFVFQTYEECAKTANSLGAGLFSYGIKQKTMLGVYSENCPYWVNTVDASGLYGFVIVSLYDSLGADSVSYLIRHSEMQAIIVSPRNLEKIVDTLLAQTYDVKSVIVMSDAIPVPTIERAKAKNIAVISIEEVIRQGAAHPIELPHIDPEDPHFICYSSGTTGNPKGVIIPHRASVNNCLSASYAIPLSSSTRYLSFLPLAHVFERAAHDIIAFKGGRIGFISGGVTKLVEDMGILKPTFFAAVPRVMNRFFEAVDDKLKNSNPVAKGVFWGAWYAKKYCLGHGLPTGIFNKIVFNSVIEKMGGCVEVFIIGGAAMDPKIHEFLQVAVGVPMRCGYGLSEAGSGNICHPNYIQDCISGTVGGPVPNCEVRLEAVSGYDDPACGEILIGGSCLSQGYLHDEQSTDALFTDKTHKFIRTGDIGKWTPDGHMIVVDRLRSIFKLSQGEYVAAEPLTQVFEKTSIVKQIFIYGDSMRTALVAIVVPNKAEAAKYYGKTDKISDDEFKAICGREEFKEEVLKQLNETAKKAKLFGYQYIKAVELEPTEWTIDGSLSFLTPTFKMKRKALGDHYKVAIEQLYASIN